MKLTANNEEAVQTAADKIAENIGCDIVSTNAATGLPDSNVQKTTAWDVPKKAYNIDLWYIEKPLEQYMVGVTGVQEQEMNPDWIEPLEV